MKIKHLPQLLFLLLLIFFQKKSFAQMGINSTGTPPASNAMLDISSTTKGLLIPRMTTIERTALAHTKGLTVFDITTNGYWYSDGAKWVNIATSSSASPWLINGNNIYKSGTAGNVGIGTTNPTDKLSVVNLLPGYGITHSYGPVKVGTYISNLYAQFGTRSNHPLQFFTNNGDAQMTLLQNGNFGVGVTSPQTTLHINPNRAGSILLGANKNTGGYTNLEMGISKSSGGYSYIQSTKASGSTWGDIAINSSGGRVSIGTTVNNSNTKLTVSQDVGNYNGIVAEGKGVNNSAIYAKGNIGADAIIIDGPIRSPNTNSKVIYRMKTQTTSPGSDGYLFDDFHPGIPGFPDGTVTILIDNPLCNYNPNAMIFCTWIGVYENNKNYQSFLTYIPFTGKWLIKYNYDTYFGSSKNQVPAFNIMIVNP